MAYPIIKSAWDNFSESYMKAREARAMEERRKEMSMREFDDNQRAWNQEQRTDDLYQSYTKPFNDYGLDNAGMTNEIFKAGQAGKVNTANFDSRVSELVTTPEQVQKAAGIFNYNRLNTYENSKVRANMNPEVRRGSVLASDYQNAAARQEAEDALNYFRTPVAEQRREKFRKLGDLSTASATASTTEDILNTAGRLNNYAYPKPEQSTAYSGSSVIPKGSRPALNKDALLSTPAAPIASAPVSTTVAQSPMAVMAAKPSTAEANYTQALEAKKAIEQKMRFMISTGRQGTEEYRNLADNLAKAQSVIDLAKFKIPNNSNK